MLGKFISYSKENNKILLQYEKGFSSIIFINEDIVRFFLNLTKTLITIW